MDPILVTGGTGTVGRHVVRRLRSVRGDVRVLTRQTPADDGPVRYFTGDLLSAAGVDLAVNGAATIVHCAGSGKDDDRATHHLVNAARRRGHPHLVYISVVGADRVPVTGTIDRALFGYFDMKRRAEQIVMESGLPWTILRSTQFHDLILFVVDKLTMLPVVPVPTGFSFQPIEADEVAARLVELALAAPSALVPDIAGPRVYRTEELIRAYLGATGRRRWLLSTPLPGKAARAVRDGANLAPSRAVGVTTWEAFLTQHATSRTRIESGASVAPRH